MRTLVTQYVCSILVTHCVQFFDLLKEKVMFKPTEKLVRGAGSLLFLFLSAAVNTQSKEEVPFENIWTSKVEPRLTAFHKEFSNVCKDHLDNLASLMGGIITSILSDASDMDFQVTKASQHCVRTITAIRQALIVRGKESIVIAFQKLLATLPKQTNSFGMYSGIVNITQVH